MYATCFVSNFYIICLTNKLEKEVKEVIAAKEARSLRGSFARDKSTEKKDGDSSQLASIESKKSTGSFSHRKGSNDGIEEDSLFVNDKKPSTPK